MTTIKIDLNCKDLARIEEVRWHEVRTEVEKINPELTKIIDEFDPCKDCTLIKASYPYGLQIRHNSEFYLPLSNGFLVTLDSLSTHLRNKLHYSALPPAFVLNKAIEVYIEPPEGRTIPFKLFSPGTIFGMWEFAESQAVTLNRGWDWNLYSGARTVFLLPKISDTLNHLKLQRKYDLHTYVPDDIFDHGKIFSEIFNYQSAQYPWECKLLFFTKTWLEPRPDNIGWIKLKEYWLRESWHRLRHWTHEITFDLSWELYIAELIKRKIKLKPYLLDTVKYLIAIGCGKIPAFRPTDESQKIAPTAIIQDAYVYDYGLKSYAPVIMQPDFLSLNNPVKHVYYSLQASTLPVKPSKLQEFTSVMQSLRDLKILLDIFMEVSREWPEIKNTLTYDFSKYIKFEYFHTEIDAYGIIKSTPHMIKEDPALGHSPSRYGKRLFPENSPFFRGCVRISIAI